MKPNTTLRRLLAIAGSAVLTAPLAHAIDGTWLGASGNWNATGTWSGGTIADGVDSTAFFTGVDITGNQTITLAADRTIGNITFTDATNSSHNLTITGNTLTLDRTIGVPTIDVTQSGRELTISSIIAGNDGLLKTGSGMLTLVTATNTYTGGTTINGGTLRVGSGANINTSALGTGTVTINTGGTLILQGASGGNYSFANSFALNGGTIRGDEGIQHIGTGVGATIDIGTSGGTVSANWTGKDVYLDGQLTGSGALLLSNFYNSQLATVHFTNAASTYSGTVSVSGANQGQILSLDHATALQYATVNLNPGTAGIMQLNAASTTYTIAGLTGTGGTVRTNTGAGTYTLNINNTNDYSYGGTLVNNTGVLALTKTGTGTQTLSGNNTYTGATTVSAGTLSMTNVSGYKTTTLSVASGATLAINMTGAVSSQAASGSSGTWTTFNTVNAAITGAGVVTLSGTGFMVAGGSGGAMTTNLSASGVLDVQSGNWQWGWGRGSAATNLGSLNVDSGAEYRNSDTDFKFDALTGSGTVANAYNGTVTLTLGVSNTTNNATYGVSGNTATFSGVIKGPDNYNNVTTGALNMVKTGTGTQILSGTNTYTGTTTVSQGTLLTTKAAALSGYNSSAKVIFNGGTVGVQVGGAGWTTTEVNALLSNATKTSGALGIDTTNGNLTQWTPFTTTNFGSTLGLTKLGSNTLILDQTNTYAGPTTVSAGTLAVNGSITSSVTVASGAILQGSGTISSSVTIQNGGHLAPGNSIESIGTGALSFLAGSTYAYELQTNLFGTTPGASADLTYTTSTLDITAGAILTLTDLAASTALANGSKLTLISYGSGWTGTELFTYNNSTLNDGATFTLGANTWLFDYNDTLEGVNYAADSPNGQSYVTMTVIPEPSVTLLGCLAALGLCLRRRR